MPSIQDSYDLIFVGGGFRFTAFAASFPEILLKYHTAVVESSSVVGPGAFAHLDGLSNSSGRSFFSDVDPSGPFGWLFTDHRTADVAASADPVRLHSLSRTLQYLGGEIASMANSVSFVLNHEAISITIGSGRDLSATVQLADGTRLKARICVLATGRRERRLPYLDRWTNVFCSSDLLCSTRHQFFKEQVQAACASSITVVGSSHSAFSVVEKLLAIVQECARESRSFLAPRIRIIYRSPFRLFHPNVTHAREHRLPIEEPADASKHVCVQTGRVFRDSGLRHGAANLLRRIVAGRATGVDMIRVAAVKDAAPYLYDASFIVTAVGYEPRAPDIFVGSDCVRACGSSTPVSSRSDGAVAFDSYDVLPIYSMRLDPTPPVLRDKGIWGAGFNCRLASGMRSRLAPLT